MPRDRDARGSALSRGGFKREQLRDAEQHDVRRTFGSHLWVETEPRRWIEAGTQRLVEYVEGVIGDGKEATVYQCRTAEGLEFERAAAKVYRAQKFRAFSNANQYVDASALRDRRKRRAVQNKTRRGRRIAHEMWIEREWATMTRLYDAGADVPQPYAHSVDAVLMEFFGDADGPAPLLRQVRLAPQELRPALDAILHNVAIFLACDRVHGDLSAYNILWWQGRATIIDLPQATEADSADAWPRLRRDVRNVCRYFARLGLQEDGDAIADDLWRQVRR